MVLNTRYVRNRQFVLPWSQEKRTDQDVCRCDSCSSWDRCHILSGVMAAREQLTPMPYMDLFDPKNQRQVTIMSAAENKELIRNMFAELGKGNVQTFLGAMADDVRFPTARTLRPMA